MKNFKRIICLVLAMVFVVIAGGCGKKTAESSDERTVASGEYVISETPLDLSIHLHYYGTRVFDDNWAVFKEAGKLTNVHLHGTASKSMSDSKMAFSTMLSTKPLPDIIQNSCAELLKIGEQGALIPLEDLIDKYAPNIKKILESSKEIRMAACSTDGHIYNIPYLPSGLEVGRIPTAGWFIRQDWLDKLGLQQPKTVEEFYAVLKAFKTQDPNGNGKKDEIPFISRQSNANDIIKLLGGNVAWFVDESGKIEYGPVQEEYKNAIKEVAKWYKEGLIDPEIFTRGKNSREILLGNNTAGCMHDNFSSTSKFNDTLADKISGFYLEAMLPPADVNGVVREVGKKVVGDGYGWGISKDNKNPIETIKYFDFWASEIGQKLSAFGIEGEHYTVIDGKNTYTDLVLKNDLSVPLYLVSQGCLMGIGTVGNIEAELSGMNEIGQNGMKLYQDSDCLIYKEPDFVFLEEERKHNTIAFTNISTFQSEQMQKWVLGVDDVDATWDSYIKKINQFGYKEVRDNHQKAYDRALKY